MRVGLITFAAASFTAVAVLGQEPADVAALVSASRAALGGEAALNRVSSFSVTASLEESLGSHALAFTVDYKAALPDRFVVTRRQVTPSGDIVYVSGFNGEDLIRDEIFNVPAPPPAIVPATPEAAATQRVLQLAGAKKMLAFLALPLLMASIPSAPVEFRAGGQSRIDGKAVDLIEVRTKEQETRRLWVSADSHLPVRLTWRAKPIVVGGTYTVTTRSVSDSRGRVIQPPTVTGSSALPAPTGNPTEGLLDVEWQTNYADYKTADGLTWPHRVVTSFDGNKFDDYRFGKFSINPKFNDSTFKVRK